MPKVARDTTTGKVVAEDLRMATSWWARFRGLMLRRALNPGEALFIAPCSSIHMMFMNFAIDAVFVDKQRRVVKVSPRVRPWIGMAWGGRGAHAVIEMAAGSGAGISPGDQLDF